MICWTLGITEHHNAVDNVLALISLVLLTGHVGRYGSGVNPLRGQNNVQGGGDMGALPDRLPGLPARRERRAAGQVRRRMGRRGPAEARLAPVGDVRCDGARRPDRGLLHRREPGPVRGRPEARDPPPRGPRLPRRPGPLPDEDRRARRRRPAGHRGLGRIGGDGHQLGAPRPARPQGGRGARGRPRRPRDRLRARQPDGRRMGRPGPRDGLERGPAALAGPCRDELRAARDRGRPPVAVLRRDAPGRAVPPLAPVGGPGPGQPRAVRPGRSRPAGRQADRGLPDPPDHRAAGSTRTTRASRPPATPRRCGAARASTRARRTRRPTASPRARSSGSSRAAARSRSRSGSTHRCDPA